MSNIIWLTGGKERPNGHKLKEWHRYQCGIILGLDLETRSVIRRIEYVSPSSVCPDYLPSISFRSATLYNNLFYVCTQTEVLVYSFPEFSLIRYLTLPIFNDLHHVLPDFQENLIVVNTGLDMVLRLDLDSNILDQWNVVSGQQVLKKMTEIDFRKIPSTKPHKSHPNYAFFVNDDLWVTRFEQKDAICLTDPYKRIEINVGHPHDGFLWDGFVYFTTVNGFIVVANIETLKIEEIYDLNKITKSNISLGWCRGIYVVNFDKVWVGFSRLRPTPFKEHISWVKGRLGLGSSMDLPTRVVEFDLTNKVIINEIVLENLGLHTLFSIFLV